MLNPAIKIVRQLEDARFSADGKHTPIIRVEFMVGNDGPFVERFPKDTFSASGVDEKLNAFALHIVR